MIPGNKRIAHHVLLFLDSTGQAEQLDAKDDVPGYECFGGPGFEVGASILDGFAIAGGWVPGMQTQALPEGVGIKLPKNARVIMQLHYFGGSQGGTDRTKAGLYFSKSSCRSAALLCAACKHNIQDPAERVEL